MTIRLSKKCTFDHGPVSQLASPGHGTRVSHASSSTGLSFAGQSESWRAICSSSDRERTQMTVRLLRPRPLPHVIEQRCQGPTHHLTNETSITALNNKNAKKYCHLGGHDCLLQARVFSGGFSMDAQYVSSTRPASFSMHLGCETLDKSSDMSVTMQCTH